MSCSGYIAKQQQRACTVLPVIQRPGQRPVTGRAGELGGCNQDRNPETCRRLSIELAIEGLHAKLGKSWCFPFEEFEAQQGPGPLD